jgi:hypothetical protein
MRLTHRIEKIEEKTASPKNAAIKSREVKSGATKKM